MSNFCEEKTGTAINWNRRLDSVIGMHEDASLPSHEQVAKWCRESSGWVTCAVGNLCDIIPRDSSGRPIDCLLNKLGSHFYVEMKVILHELDYGTEAGMIKAGLKAKNTLSAIEKRSAELIKGSTESIMDGGKA